MNTWWILVILSLFSQTLSSTLKDTNHKDGGKSHRKNPKSRQTPGQWPTLTGEPILLMAHRGEKVLMPEHTIGSYALGSIEGADYVEPDLVLTSDGVLVCFHDLTLGRSTDVREKFPEKMVGELTGVIDEGFPEVTIRNEWLINNFTLAELQTLNVIQRDVGIRPRFFNELFTIPTFKEYLDTMHHNAYKMNKSIGIIPELKHPWFHNNYYPGSPKYMEETLLKTLSDYGYPLDPTSTPGCTSKQDANVSIPCSPLVIQSFELSCIKYLSGRTPTVDLMMLIDVQLPLLTYEGLKEVAPYAKYYSLGKELLYTGILAKIEQDKLEVNQTEIDLLGGFIPPRSIVTEAHKLGMKVGIYTIYDSREPSNRGCAVKCDPENKEMELYYFFDMGVDGMFVENVMEARELRMKYYYEVLLNLNKTPDPNPNYGLRISPSLATVLSLIGLLFKG